MERYVIAYDIKDDRRRNRVFKVLKEHATHLQYSLFEACTTKENMVLLKYQLRKIINTKEDSVFIYRQCGFCCQEIERLGIPVVIYGETDIII